MGRTTKFGPGRAATFLAALGLLVMSSGIALMVAATPANASATKYFVCKYVGTPGVNETLQTGQNPISVAASAIKEDPIVIGSFFADGQGRSLVLVQDTGQDTPPVSDCIQTPPTPKDATANVTFVDPSCANESTPSYNTAGDFVSFAVTDGSVAPDTSVTVTATADAGHEFADGSTTKDFSWDFGPAVDLNAPPCVTVNPPTVVTPQDPQFADPTCLVDGSVTLPTPIVLDRKASGPVLQTADVNGVHYVVTGALTAGSLVEVDATPLDGFEFTEGAVTHWSHTMTVPTGCTVVNPPTTAPPTVEPPSPTVTSTVSTPTVVEAGLVSMPTAQDLRGEQGLALLVTGLLMMAAAGGLGLVRNNGGKTGH